MLPPWVSSRYSGFLSQSKDVSTTVTFYSKLPIDVNVCSSLTCSECTMPFAKNLLELAPVFCDLQWINSIDYTLRGNIWKM